MEKSIEIVLASIESRLERVVDILDDRMKGVQVTLTTIQVELKKMDEKLDEVSSRVIGAEKDIERYSEEFSKCRQDEKICVDLLWENSRRLREEIDNSLVRIKEDIVKESSAETRNRILALKVWILLQGLAIIGLFAGWIMAVILKKI